MIVVKTGFKTDITFNRREILRYLGYGKATPEEGVEILIDEAMAEVREALDLKACYTIADGKEWKEKSKDLKKNLKDSTEVYLFAATLGYGVDLLLRKYSTISPAKAVVVQAVAADAIEAWCDIICEGFKKERGRIRPRFSPGYGDLSLDCQKEITEILDTGRKIGLGLTESMLMAPSKSVTAIVGIV